MCAGCPQEFRWRRRVAWPGCLQRTRIPRGSLPLVSRRREVFVPRNQRCGLLRTRPRRLLSPSAGGRLAAGEAAEVVEAGAAGGGGGGPGGAGGGGEGGGPGGGTGGAVGAEGGGSGGRHGA